MIGDLCCCCRRIRGYFHRFLKYTLFHDKVTIKNQLLISFSLTALFAGGLTLAICLGMVYALGADAFTASKGIITDQSISSVYVKANEIASSINQQLLTIAQSVCLGGALYSSSLLGSTLSSSRSTYLTPQETYREYKFQGECNYPNCPTDYGPLAGRSRFPLLPGFINGSLLHSSLYTYSISNQAAVRDDTNWYKYYNNYNDFKRVVDGLTYQDTDLEIVYTRGPETTVMFYVSAATTLTSGEQISLHRTFPGIVKNITTYNAYARPWFAKAPIDGVYFYGPYQETFTRQLVVTLSSKKISYALSRPVTVVSAAVLLLTDMQSIISSIKYSNDGYGVLLKYDTLEVIVWKNSDYSTFDYNSGKFYTVDYFDPNLAKLDLRSSQTQSYTDSSNVNWLVSSVPFFTSTTYKSSSGSNALIMLVFSNQELAYEPINSLKTNINNTTAAVTITTVAICVALIGIELIIIITLVIYLTRPLEKMRAISADIVRMSALEEENKDYGKIVEDAYLDLTRTDEIGALSTEYFNVLCVLHERITAKKRKPKFPDNPFYSEEHSGLLGTLMWLDASGILFSKLNARTQAPTVYEVAPPPSFPAASAPPADLDILGGLTVKPTVIGKPQTHFAIATSEEDELAAAGRFSTASLFPEQDNSLRKIESKKFNVFSSAKTKFYSIF